MSADSSLSRCPIVHPLMGSMASSLRMRRSSVPGTRSVSLLIGDSSVTEMRIHFFLSVSKGERGGTVERWNGGTVERWSGRPSDAYTGLIRGTHWGKPQLLRVATHL